MKLSQEIGIDLGTTTVLIYIKDKGIVLNEPSVVAIDKTNSEIVAYGKEAEKLVGRVSKNIETIYPLKDGVISDYKITEKMLKHYIAVVSDQKVINPSLVICVPSGVTNLEKKAVIDAALLIGARRVNIIQEPLAAAIGAGVDIMKPRGTLVIDIGGGTTDIAVISLGGIVKSGSIKIAGNAFNNEIMKYVKSKYSLIIGEKTAEKVKIEIGAVYRKTVVQKIKIRGKDILTGFPKGIELTSDEIYEIFMPLASRILFAVREVLEDITPELAADIKENTVYITGGGSLIDGVDRLIFEKLGLKTRIPDKPIECVAQGTGKALEYIHLLENGNGIMAR